MKARPVAAVRKQSRSEKLKCRASRAVITPAEYGKSRTEFIAIQRLRLTVTRVSLLLVFVMLRTCSYCYRCHTLTPTTVTVPWPRPLISDIISTLEPPSASGNCSSPSIIMTIVDTFYTPITQHASSSPPNGVDIPEETSPLLEPGRTPGRTIAQRWTPARSPFLEANLGLFLVASGECLVAATNTAVKLLNSSDEPVPTLEVCDGPRSHILAWTDSVMRR